MNLLKSEFFLFIIFTIGLALLWDMNRTAVYEEVPFDIDGALKRETASQNYFDKKIVTAIQNEKFDDVEMYQNLANYLDVNLSQATRDEITKNSDFISEAIRDTKEFSAGFISGEGESAVALSGSVLSDLTVVGDVRDLSIEGNKFAHDEKYDRVVFGLSLIGVGLSASQLLSAGATTPLKVGASVVKVAKKTGKISEPFLNILSSKLAKSIDIKMLKTIDFSTMSGIKKIEPTIRKSLKLEHISKLFGKINQVKKNTSLFDTVTLLKYVDNEKDLAKLVKVSSRYKKNTRGVLKVLGKGAFRGATRVLKRTTMFINRLFWAVVSFVTFMVGTLLNIRRLFSIIFSRK